MAAARMADARTSRPGVIVTMAQALDSAEAAREPTMPTNAKPGPAASLLSMDIRRGPPMPVEPEPAELAVEPEPTEPDGSRCRFGWSRICISS